VQKIKILGLPSDEHDGACAHYRVIWPLEELAKLDHIDVYIPPIVNGRRLIQLDQDNNPTNDPNPNLANNYDMIVLQRQPEQDVTRLIRACKELGIKTVFDIDDNALNIPKWNPNYLVWGRDSRHIYHMAQEYMSRGRIPTYLRGKTPEQIMKGAPGILQGLLTNIRECDLVTVTTPTLQNVYSMQNSNIAVLPNQMQPTFWEDTTRITHNGEIWVGWAGGWTHEQDLKILIGPLRAVLRKRENVKFVIIGWDEADKYVFTDFPSDRIKLFPWADFSGYHDQVASLDVVLAPSIACPFNVGKSDIRVLEAWLCKRPCVASPTTYADTIREAQGGLIAKKSASWVRNILRLVDDPKLRDTMGYRGYDYVMAHRTYQKTAHLWIEAYRSLVH